jgi:hypothetical protein
MTYVPIVTPPASTPPSPRTRELADLLAKVLEEYTKAHPATTRAEIRAAVSLAARRAGPGGSKPAAALGLSLGLGIAAFVLGLVFLERGGGVEIGPVLPMIVLALIIFLALTLIAIRRRSE